MGVGSHAWPAQGRVDLAFLVSRIRVEFPHLAFHKATLNDEGEDHAVVVLDDARVFRFPRDPRAASLALRERRLLTRLNDISPVPTPRYDLVSKSGDFAGYPMIVGEETSPAVFLCLSRVAQEKVLHELGGFLAALHALPGSVLARHDLTAEVDWRTGAHHTALYRERRPRFVPVLAPALLARVDRFFEALPRAVDWPPDAVIYGDLTADHILLAPSGDRLAGIIDFTDAAVGDPAFDFTYLWAYGDWAPAQAADAYGGDQALLTRSRWWFARYSIDQLWWNLSGARAYDVGAITREVSATFEVLGV